MTEMGLEDTLFFCLHIGKYTTKQCLKFKLVYLLL